MKRKILFGSIISLVVVVAAIITCLFIFKDDEPVQNTDPKYEIYKLAAESGFDGTYEEWLDSISGREVQLQVSDDSIEWKYNTDTTWKELCSLESLTGSKGENGEDGKEVELSVESGYIKWRYVDESTWKELIAITDLIGAKGDSIELNVTDTYLQWKYQNETEWINLLELSSLIGSKGDKGDKGDAGSEVELTVESGYIKWKYHDEEGWSNLIDLRTLTGSKGDKGEDGKEVKFNVTQEYIQWKYDGDSSWRNLIALSLITGEKGDKGDAGSEVELTVESGYIKWKYHDEDEWSNLIDINSLIGEKGDKGDDGKEVLFNVSSTHIQWKYQGESSWNDLVDLSILKGEKGDKGEDAKTVEFRVNGTWVQWKYTSDDEWINLYEVNGNIAPTGLAHVKFVLNGGSMDGYQSEMDVTMGYSIELPTPKKHGYTFLGWYENTTDEYAVPSTYRVHESINLYAKWEAGAVITGTKIYNLNDLVKIKNNLSGTYVLMNDIDCNGLALQPIGNKVNSFSGIFEGQGYTISNYKLSVDQYNGLFGYNSGSIRNLNVEKFSFILENSTTAHPFYIGGLVGYNTGDIYSCKSESGTINVKFTNKRVDVYGGLLVGYNKGNLHDIIVTGNLVSYTNYSYEGYNYLGGISGYNNGNISNSFANCNISSDYAGDDAYAGLISGYNKLNIYSCIAKGTVYSKGYSGYTSTSFAGDIAAYSGGSIKNCYVYENSSITSPGSIKTFGTKMSLETMSDYNFYLLTLEWDENIWNYYYVDLEQGIYPTLLQNN